MSAKTIFASAAVVTLLCASCASSGHSDDFRVEAAVLDSEAETLRVLDIAGANSPPTIDFAMECNSMSGTTLPLKVFLSWKLPREAVAAEKTRVKSELIDRGYRTLSDFGRLEYGEPGVSAEFARDAGQGRKLKASVAFVFGAAKELRIAIELSPSSAC